MQTKTCTKCGEEKALTEYHKNKTCKYGVNSQCKPCVIERNREYYSRPEIQEKMKEYKSRPEVRERIRKAQHKHRQKPEVKEKRREYLKSPKVLAYHRAHAKARREMGIDYTSHIEVTKKYAIRSGTPWSDAEVKFLMSSDLSLVDIAMELGRSYESVRNKRDKMRNDNIHTVSINNATRSRTQWSKTEDERLLAHKGALVDIALELGRSYDSVVKRRAKLLQSK